MADYSMKTIKAVTYEVALPNPTNTVEMEKALAYARSAFVAVHKNKRIMDDTFKVIADEEHIRIQWLGPVTETPRIEGLLK